MPQRPQNCTGYMAYHVQQGTDLSRWTIAPAPFIWHDANYLDGEIDGKQCIDYIKVDPIKGVQRLESFHPVQYPVGLIAELLDSGYQRLEVYYAVRPGKKGNLRYDLLLKAGNDFYDLSLDPPAPPLPVQNDGEAKADDSERTYTDSMMAKNATDTGTMPYSDLTASNPAAQQLPNCPGYKVRHPCNISEWDFRGYVNTHPRDYLEGLIDRRNCDDRVVVDVLRGIHKWRAFNYGPVQYEVGLIAEILSDASISAIAVLKADKKDGSKQDLILQAGGMFYDLSLDPPLVAEIPVL